jgi:hypothetical protein
MKLGELLDELRVNILNDRSDRTGGSSDYLWTDATLTRYINEAQRRFARKGLVIRDSRTADCCEVTLVTGQNQYTLHASVLAVISARLDGDPADLVRGGHAAFDTYHQPDAYYFDPSQLSTIPPGKPLAYSTDETLAADDNGSVGAMSLRIYPPPTATYAGQKIKLRVARLPLEVLKGASAVPEIPEDHHIEMLDWAAYLALRIVDHDAGNVARANEFRASFEDHVRNARNTAMRKLFAPTQWGFGRNGFSWER